MIRNVMMRCRCIEQVLLVSGALLIALDAAAYIHRTVMVRAELIRFDTTRDSRREFSTANQAILLGHESSKIDFSQWSEQRMQAYEQSLATKLNPPLAVLRVPKVHIEVPVLGGIDELTLNRAVGFIPGTSAPGHAGNIGIAGHRDGFFRPLKDVVTGDTVELQTSATNNTYVVDEILIVKPDDVSVLLPRSSPSITLVTCYPFYFLGRAPRRYIVHASLVNFASSRNIQPQSASTNRGEPESHDSRPQSRNSKEEAQ